jgi:hypothetical protein
MSGLRPGNTLKMATLAEKQRASQEGNATKRLTAEQANYWRGLNQQQKAEGDAKKANAMAGANFNRDIRMVAMSPRGIGGQAYNSINRAERAITTLASGQDTPEAWGELAVAAATVAGGGVPHESVIKSLKPDGFRFSIARAKEYLSSMPVAVGAQGWQDWYKQFFDRERKLMTDQYREAALKAVTPHIPYMQANPELARATLKQHLIDDAVDPQTFYPNTGQTMGGVPYESSGPPGAAPGAPSGPGQHGAVVRTGTNKATGKKVYQYADGFTEER